MREYQHYRTHVSYIHYNKSGESYNGEFWRGTYNSIMKWIAINEAKRRKLCYSDYNHAIVISHLGYI